MCLSNVYENSVEQKNLILSNVQRIDCKDGFVVLVDLFERETRVEGRLATIDLVGNTAIIVKDCNHCGRGRPRGAEPVRQQPDARCFFEEIETDDPAPAGPRADQGKQVELTVDEKENGDLTVDVVCGGVSQKILMTRL